MGNKPCIVKGCKSQTENNDPTIKFYRIPDDCELKTKWKINLSNKLKAGPVTSSSRICSLHFKDSSIIPTIFPSIPRPDVVSEKVFEDKQSTKDQIYENVEYLSQEVEENDVCVNSKNEPAINHETSFNKFKNLEKKQTKYFEKVKFCEIFLDEFSKIYAKCSIFTCNEIFLNYYDLLQHFIKEHASDHLDYLIQDEEECKIAKSKFEESAEIFFKKSNKRNFADVSKVNSNFSLNKIKIRKTNREYNKGSFELEKEGCRNEFKNIENAIKENNEQNINLRIDSVRSLADSPAIDTSDSENSSNHNIKENHYLKETDQELLDIKDLNNEITENDNSKKKVDTNIEYITDLDHIQELDEKFLERLSSNDYATCRVCNIIIRNISEHYRRHHPNSYICRVGKCYEQLSSLPEFNTHKQRIHPKSAFSCTLCGSNFTQITHLRFHYQRIHLNHKDYPCNFCEKKFFTRGERRRHERVHTGQKPFKCNYCNLTFPSGQQRNNHTQVKHKEPKFNCNFCDKKYHTKQYLKEHLAIHGEKRYVCHECGGKYFFLDHLKRHYNKKHKESADQTSKLNFKCDICKEKFKAKDDLKTHVMSNHFNTHNLKE